MGDRAAFVFDAKDMSSPAHYKASQTALLLMDFHNLFVRKAGGNGAEAALRQAIKLRDWSKQTGILVVHALVDVASKPFATCKGAVGLSSILSALRDHPEDGDEPETLKGDPEVEPLLTRTPGYVSVLKSEGFDQVITARGIKSLILCGLSTSGCVMRTAFSASDAEFVVTVIEDACADPKEGLHKTLVESVLPSRTHCCSLEEFLAAWEERSSTQ